MMDDQAIQRWIHENLHPQLLFMLKDKHDVFPTKMRTTIIFGAGHDSHFLETELNLSGIDLDKWYEDNLKRIVLHEAQETLNTDDKNYSG